MNFFGHYFLDHKPTAYWYNIGLIYPDLFRDLFKKQEPKLYDISIESPTESRGFVAGIHQHLKTDALFHHHVFFHTAQKVVKKKMEDLDMMKLVPRSFFAVHVFAELLIDRQLVAKYPECATQMYIDIQSVLNDSSIYDNVFTKKESVDIFLHRLSRIHADKFIFAYTNNQKLIATLYSIYAKMNIQFTTDQLRDLVPKWNQFLEELEEDYTFNIEQFKHEKEQ